MNFFVSTMLHMFIKCLYIITMCLILGCGVADLRGSIANNVLDKDQIKGKEIIDITAKSTGVLEHLSKFSTIHIVATDYWTHTMFRWLTPIPTKQQRISFKFSLNSLESQMTFMDGPRQGDIIGLRSFQSYRIIKGVPNFELTSDVDLYLMPMRNYFLFTQILLNRQSQIYLEEVKLNDVYYDKVFVAHHFQAVKDQEDQYILWVNRQTKKIDYIEYTFRKLLNSYRGVIAYADYRLIEGIWMPFEISLPDKINSKSYTHRIKIEDIKFK